MAEPDAPSAARVVFAGITSRSSTSCIGAPSTLTAMPLAGLLPVLLATSVSVTRSSGFGLRFDALMKTCSSAPSATVTVSTLAAVRPCSTLRARKSSRATRSAARPVGRVALSTRSADSPGASGPKVAPSASCGSPVSALPLPLRSQVRVTPCRSKSSSLRFAKLST